MALFLLVGSSRGESTASRIVEIVMSNSTILSNQGLLQVVHQNRLNLFFESIQKRDIPFRVSRAIVLLPLVPIKPWS